MAWKMEEMSTGMPGTKRNVRNGRKARKVRRPVQFPISGIIFGSLRHNRTINSSNQLSQWFPALAQERANIPCERYDDEIKNAPRVAQV